MKKDVSLRPYNTFGIDVKTSGFVAIETVTQLQELMTQDNNYFVLGGGSNMLLTQDIQKTVLHIALKGYEIVDSNFTQNELLLKVAAGENWHDFVLYCITNDYGGVENLSLIHI